MLIDIFITLAPVGMALAAMWLLLLSGVIFGLKDNHWFKPVRKYIIKLSIFLLVIVSPILLMTTQSLHPVNTSDDKVMEVNQIKHEIENTTPIDVSTLQSAEPDRGAEDARFKPKKLEKYNLTEE
jgi:hypothetical protein